MDNRKWYLVTVARRYDKFVEHSWVCDIVADNTDKAIDQALRGISDKYKVISVAVRGTKEDYETKFGVDAESN